MTIPKIKEFDIGRDNPLLRKVDALVRNSYWHLGGSGLGAKTAWGGNIEQNVVKDKKLVDNPEGYTGMYGEGMGSAMRVKLNANGTIKQSAHWKKHPSASGVYRQPWGWSNSSVQRRAPEIYDLFQYINKEFLNGEFAMNGFGEEIGGTRPMWSEKFGDDKNIPGYGNLPDIGNPPGIWTCYVTGKAGGILLENPKGAQPRRSSFRMRGSAGLHRDATVIKESDGSEYYSLVVVLNPKWHPSWEGAARYHETIDDPFDADETHWKRGYGLGHPTSIHPQKPGAVYLVPATAVHSGLDLYIPNRPDYQRRLLFRIKRIGADHYVSPNLTCECGWEGTIPADANCPKCHKHVDVRKAWGEATWVKDETIGEPNPELLKVLNDATGDEIKEGRMYPGNEEYKPNTPWFCPTHTEAGGH
jgi:hypothetical protein